MLKPQPSLSSSDAGAPQPLVLTPRAAVLLALAMAAVITVAGSVSDVSLGDEVIHFRHAETFTQGWTRQPFDPLTVTPSHRDQFPLNNTPAWHIGLAMLWRLVGTDSQVVAQLWNAGFYVLLVLSIYFAARQLWGDSAATWAFLLAATLPLVLAYSEMLYVDIPGLALSALAILLLWRRQFALCGLALALAFLTKMNMLSFLPWAAVFAVWWARGRWPRRAVAALLVAAPVVAVFLWDLHWRHVVFDRNLLGSQRFYDLNLLSEAGRNVLRTMPAGYVLWKPFPFNSPTAVILNLGAVLLPGLLLALAWSWDRQSRWLWACAALCVAGFFAVFVRLHSPQIRYLLPAILVLVYLAGAALSRLRLRRWQRVAIVAVCLLQGATVVGFVTARRIMPAAERAALVWMREHVPPGCRVMTPDVTPMLYANRANAWGALNPAEFTTEASDEGRKALLDYLNVSHIAIPFRRVYDPAVQGVHVGGYPMRFLAEARRAPYLEKVFENGAVVIFRYKELHPVPPGK